MSKWLAKAIAFVIALFFVHAQGAALAFASMPSASSATHSSISAQTVVIHPADDDEEEEDEEDEEDDDEDDSVVIPPIVVKPKPTPTPTSTSKPKPTPTPTTSPRPGVTPSPSQSSEPTPEPTRDNNPDPSPTGSTGSGSSGTTGNNSGRGSSSGGNSFVLAPLNINIGGSKSNHEANEHEIFPEENPPMLAPEEALAGRTPADEFFQAATIGLVALCAAALSLGGIAVQRSISLRRNPEADFIYESSSN